MEYSDTYDAVETCGYCGAPMIPVIGDDALRCGDACPDSWGEV